MSFRASWTWWCQKKLHCGQRDMCSWSMVNNEENWLLWQIKDWFNNKNKKYPKSAQSLGLVKFQVPSPQRVNAVIMKSSNTKFTINLGICVKSQLFDLDSLPLSEVYIDTCIWSRYRSSRGHSCLTLIFWSTGHKSLLFFLPLTMLSSPPPKRGVSGWAGLPCEMLISSWMPRSNVSQRVHSELSEITIVNVYIQYYLN